MVTGFPDIMRKSDESADQFGVRRDKENFKRWKETWDNHHRDLFFVKSKDWEYEREYRVLRYPALFDIAAKVARQNLRAPAIEIGTALKAIIVFGDTPTSPFVRTIQRLMNGSVQLLAISHSTGAFSVDEVAPPREPGPYG